MRRVDARVVRVHLRRGQGLERRRRLHRPELVHGRRDHSHQRGVSIVRQHGHCFIHLHRVCRALVHGHPEPVRGGGDVDGAPLALHGHLHRAVLMLSPFAVSLGVVELEEVPRVDVGAADER